MFTQDVKNKTTGFGPDISGISGLENANYKFNCSIIGYHFFSACSKCRNQERCR